MYLHVGKQLPSVPTKVNQVCAHFRFPRLKSQTWVENGTDLAYVAQELQVPPVCPELSIPIHHEPFGSGHFFARKTNPVHTGSKPGNIQIQGIAARENIRLPRMCQPTSRMKDAQQQAFSSFRGKRDAQ